MLQKVIIDGATNYVMRLETRCLMALRDDPRELDELDELLDSKRAGAFVPYKLRPDYDETNGYHPERDAGKGLRKYIFILETCEHEIIIRMFEDALPKGYAPRADMVERIDFRTTSRRLLADVLFNDGALLKGVECETKPLPDARVARNYAKLTAPEIRRRAEIVGEEIAENALQIVKGLRTTDPTAAAVWASYAETGSMRRAAREARISLGKAHKILHDLQTRFGVRLVRGNAGRYADEQIGPRYRHNRTIKTRHDPEN